ncbi:Uncharacterised protein [uncultured archaeon]|nr:Uncharacterised protein [uncultured archaeon]
MLKWLLCWITEGEILLTTLPLLVIGGVVESGVEVGVGRGVINGVGVAIRVGVGAIVGVGVGVTMKE